MNPALVEGEISDSPDLLALAQEGDRDAFGQLCRIHGSRLLRQATAICGDAALAEDLAQDTLFEAWKCIRRYNGRCLFFTWLCAILLNQHRNFRRRRRPVPLATLGCADREGAESFLDRLPDTASSPDLATVHAERAALVRHRIDQLGPKHREVIYLRFYVDDSLEGIADALGCSVGTVKSRLFYALEQLRVRQGPGFDELALD